MIMSSDGFKVFDTDSAADVEALKRQSYTYGYNEAWQRNRKKYDYCSMDLVDDYGIPGLEMIDADQRPAMLEPDEYRDAIKYAIEWEKMPYFFAYKWRPKGFRYTQNGIGYCWTWGGTGCVMTTRAFEGKPLVYLAPVSMGYLVGWANRGNYLASFIKGAREEGIYPGTSSADLNNHSRNRNNWPFDEKRELYLLDEIWDLDTRNMTQQCVTCLCAGRSIYIAYNWWGHALELVGVRYNGNTMEWIISNSHNEDDFIILTGGRAIPDEAICFVSTRSTNESSYSELYVPATAS